MATGGEIELIAVPGADDVALLAKSQPSAFFIRRDDLFDLMKNLALANRAAGVRTDVFVGQHLAASAEDADFEIIEGKNAVIAVGDIAQLPDCNFLHRHPPSVLLRHSIPGGR